MFNILQLETHILIPAINMAAAAAGGNAASPDSHGPTFLNRLLIQVTSGRGEAALFTLVTCAALSCALLVFFLYISRSGIKEIFRGAGGSQNTALALIVLSALCIRLFVIPHRALSLNDEFYCMQQARVIGNPSFAALYPYYKSTVWPFLLSLFFSVSGPNMETAFILNAVIGALSAILIFLAAYSITDSRAAALIAALFLAADPVHALWSGTAKPNIVSVALILLFFFGYSEFLKTGRRSHFFMALFAALTASQARTENSLLFLLLLPLILNRDFRNRMRGGYMLPCWGAALLAVPSLAYDFLLKFTVDWVGGSPAGESAAGNMSFSHIAVNNAGLVSDMRAASVFALFIIATACAGIYMLIASGRKRVVSILLGYLFVYWLFLSASWPTIAFRERFAIYYALALYIPAGFALGRLVEAAPGKSLKTAAAALLIAFTAVTIKPFYAKAMNPKEGRYLYGTVMTDFVRNSGRYFPKGSVVVMHDPSVLQATTNIPIMRDDQFLKNAAKFGKDVKFYYVEDLFSQKRGTMKRMNRGFCFKMVKRFVPYRHLGIYRILPAEGGGCGKGLTSE